jgi:hypothetical protein
MVTRIPRWVPTIVLGVLVGFERSSFVDIGRAALVWGIVWGIVMTRMRDMKGAELPTVQDYAARFFSSGGLLFAVAVVTAWSR